MRQLHFACLVLTIIGAINWGLWGLFQVDLVASIFGGQTEPGARLIYSIVGLAGVCLIGTTMAMYSPEDARWRQPTSPMPR